MRNSIMSVVGTHGTIERPSPPAKPTPVPGYDSFAAEMDSDCRVCGYHQCDCAPKPGFEHWGRMQRYNGHQAYFRKDTKAMVARRPEGWLFAVDSLPAPGRGTSATDAMRLADEKSPMTKPLSASEAANIHKRLHEKELQYRRDLGYRDEVAFIPAKRDVPAPMAESQYLKQGGAFQPDPPYVPVSGFNLRRWDAADISEPKPIPEGWTQVKSVNGLPAYLHESQNVGVVVRTDHGPKMYASCGVIFMATGLEDACKHALNVLAPMRQE